MAKQIIKSTTCDRCFIERPATTTVQFCFGDGTYVLDLCDQHAELWEQDLLAWVRLARDADKPHTEDPAKRAWTPGARYAPKVAIPDLPPVFRHEEPDVTPWDGPEPILDPRPDRSNGETWTFSTHAEERMQQRNVTATEALWAATNPKTRRPGREPELTVHEADDIKVVVNERRKVIVTVSRKDLDDGSQDRD